MSVCRVSQVLSFVVLGYVCAQEYFEELHMAHYPKFSKIPKKFELRSDTAHSDFKKYASEIENLAQRNNATVVYKIKVEVSKPYKHITKLLRKNKSKKYNVPLKKNSMKLSNFESFLRKMAEQSNHKSQKFDLYLPSSTSLPRILTTKQLKMKYKPIPSKLNSYTKVVKPVRERLITLT